MKCSWLPERSFNSEARHLAMNAAGVTARERRRPRGPAGTVCPCADRNAAGQAGKPAAPLPRPVAFGVSAGAGGAVSRQPRSRAMQAGLHRVLPVAHRAAHIAGVGRIAGGFDRARPCGGSALPPSRQALHGQRGGELAVAHADPGRGVGAAPGGRQPVQVRAPVCGAQARTAPVGSGVPEVGGNDRGAARRGQGVAGGGDPAPDADGAPTQRDTDAALGGCGPRSGGAAIAGRQDGSAAGPVVSSRRTGAVLAASRRRQPLGNTRAETRDAFDEREHLLGCHARARRAGRCAASRSAAQFCVAGAGPGRKPADHAGLG